MNSEDNNINNDINNINKINFLNIKKELIKEENDIKSIDSDNVKIKKEKDDFFNKSFFFEENDNYKNRLRRRNKSLDIRSNSKKNYSPIPAKKKISFSSGKNKINKFSNNNNNYINNKIEEKDLRGHMIKKNGNVIGYKMMKHLSGNNKKIIFLCNNDECRGKGAYFVDKNIFKETEKHNFKLNHFIAPKNTNIKKLLIKDKSCDGYQLLKNDKIIKDKKVIYIK